MLEVNNIYKSYKDKKVLSGVTFSAENGEIFAVVGKNGIGKTTLLDIVSGVTRPDVGFIRLDGKDIRALLPIPNVFGYVEDGFTAFPYLTAREQLSYLAVATMLPPDLTRARIEYLADLFGFTEDLDRTLYNFSKGMQKRFSIACALLGNPKVIIMDEPTASLDSEAKDELIDVFKKIKRSGKIVVMSTNSLYDVERYCDKVALMSRGRIAFQCEVSEIVEKSQSGYVIFGTRENLKILAENFFPSTDFYLNGYDDKLVVIPIKEINIDSFMEIIKHSQIPLSSIMPYQESFKDLFFKEARK